MVVFEQHSITFVVRAANKEAFLLVLRSQAYGSLHHRKQRVHVLNEKV